MTGFGQKLLQWYHIYKRKLPWRETADPYKIWVSEIILQQTQVVQGLGYYQKFTSQYPDVQSLAKADEDDVLRLWQGLGYYSRARNMLDAARTIVRDHDGLFPTSYKSILALKGIGPYTAAAIASIAYQLPHAVLDGNVYRFLSRYFGIDTPVDSTEGKKQFEALARRVLDHKHPAEHNQAMMEMGALVCKPKAPLCHDCPFRTDCVAFLTGRTASLPVKTKKIRQRQRYFHYFLVSPSDDSLLITKRKEKDIWQNLYQLPMLESEAPLSAQHFQDQYSAAVVLLKDTRHILSHQIIHLRFFGLCKESLDKLGLNGHIEIKPSQYESYAFPQPVATFLHEQALSGYGRH